MVIFIFFIYLSILASLSTTSRYEESSIDVTSEQMGNMMYYGGRAFKAQQFRKEYRKAAHAKKFEKSIVEYSNIQSNNNCHKFDACYSLFFQYFQVMNYFEEKFCGGVAIAPHFILTVAECVSGITTFDYLKFHSIFETLEKDYGHFVEIHKIIINEEYYRAKTEIEKRGQNIALLYTRKKIPDSFFFPISTQKEENGDVGIFISFGNDSNNYYSEFQFQPTLKQTFLTVVNNKKEKSPSVFFTSEHTHGAEIGSPIIFKEGLEVGGLLVGSPLPTESDNFSEFIRVSDFKSWIDDEMEKVLRDGKKKFIDCEIKQDEL